MSGEAGLSNHARLRSGILRDWDIESKLPLAIRSLGGRMETTFMLTVINIYII